MRVRVWRLRVCACVRVRLCGRADDLTPLQARRSVMVMYERLSSFQVRFAINQCCTTGRNFLFGGVRAAARRIVLRH